jgi:hypothetical protein
LELIYNISVENGKYNVVLTEKYEVKFLRDGEEWVTNPPGSKMLIALMAQQENLEIENKRLREVIEDINEFSLAKLQETNELGYQSIRNKIYTSFKENA